MTRVENQPSDEISPSQGGSLALWMLRPIYGPFVLLQLLVVMLGIPVGVWAQEQEPVREPGLNQSAEEEQATEQESFDRLTDRGEGIPTSMFGIYIRPGELLVYPYFEYYRDNNLEYKPSELGVVGNRDFRGSYRAREYLIFLGYGISERFAAEFEAAAISASLEKSPEDPSDLPQRIEESGISDVEASLRWRWNRETESRPELFSYFETVFPLQDPNKLTGTSSWEFQFGMGMVRGLRWGTITLRAAAGYEEGGLEFGEYAFEYLKRTSNWLRLFAAIEGTEDEVELITEVQLFLGSHLILKLNNAFGLTSKATDWAPEIGLMFSFPVGPGDRGNER